MIEKSQVLSTVQQIKLRKLELETEALLKQVQCQSNPDEQSLIETNRNRPPSGSTLSAIPHGL